MRDIRDYDLSWTTVHGFEVARVTADDQTQQFYSPIPTLAEAEAFLEQSLDYVDLRLCFRDCDQMIAAPDISSPDNIGFQIFAGCSKLRIAPAMFANYWLFEEMFSDCVNMVQGAVIPVETTTADGAYLNCSELRAPVSIPADCSSIRNIYKNCAKLSGEFIVRSSPYDYSEALAGTTQPITIYGERTRCEAIAATANNGNATWSPWYDPVPAVTDRGQGSYTTADDITRMVRNGALAVNSYAPGRMVYHQGDIVRADEWAALVEAAQTIDPTVTLSTHYSNLNKIEAAFDSAL